MDKQTELLQKILDELGQIKTLLKEAKVEPSKKGSLSLKVNGKSSLIRTPDFKGTDSVEFGAFEEDA